MGLCMSSGWSSAAVRSEPQPSSTAMVLLPTGELRDYPPPTTAAEALEDSAAGDGGWFLCDADDMGFEGLVPAMDGGEELRAGQIYFVLPTETLRDGLTREDVAALAVRANDALEERYNAAAAACGCSGWFRRRRARSVSPIVFAPPPDTDENAAYRTVSVATRRSGARVKMQTRFPTGLGVIPEFETLDE